MEAFSVTTVEKVGQFVVSFITYVVGWVEDFLSIIGNNPILFTFVVAVPLVGLGVGLLNRLIRAN